MAPGAARRRGLGLVVAEDHLAEVGELGVVLRGDRLAAHAIGEPVQHRDGGEQGGDDDAERLQSLLNLSRGQRAHIRFDVRRKNAQRLRMKIGCRAFHLVRGSRYLLHFTALRGRVHIREQLAHALLEARHNRLDEVVILASELRKLGDVDRRRFSRRRDQRFD